MINVFWGIYYLAVRCPFTVRKVFQLLGRNFEMWLSLLGQNAARKANQLAIVAEKKREDAPEEPRGVSKQKWFEEKKRKIGKQLEANGLDMSKAYMLDTQEDAEAKYKKWEKKPAPFGWDGE
jgi:pre-mRNA-splicing factor SYF2